MRRSGAQKRVVQKPASVRHAGGVHVMLRAYNSN